MSYTIDCLKTHTEAACEILCDAVLNPMLDYGEVGWIIMIGYDTGMVKQQLMGGGVEIPDVE